MGIGFLGVWECRSGGVWVCCGSVCLDVLWVCDVGEFICVYGRWVWMGGCMYVCVVGM